MLSVRCIEEFEWNTLKGERERKREKERERENPTASAEPAAGAGAAAMVMCRRSEPPSQKSPTRKTTVGGKEGQEESSKEWRN